MITVLKALVGIITEIVVKLLPWLSHHAQQQDNVDYVGHDTDLQHDINNDIEDQVDGD